MNQLSFILLAEQFGCFALWYNIKFAVAHVLLREEAASSL